MNAIKYFMPCLALAFFACTNESEPAALDGHAVAMSVRTEMVSSRNMITDNRFADGASLGITVVDDRDGVFTYDGLTEGYYNVRYDAHGTSPDQSWTAFDKPIYLSSSVGRAIAYYPYSSACTDFRAIPVQADDQTDYMYSGWVKPVSNVDSEATFNMKHALSGVRIAVKRGSYTGVGKVSEIYLTSKAFGVSGVLDATTGLITDVKPAETEAEINTYMMKPAFKSYVATDADFTNTLLMVIPKNGVRSNMNISVVIDGRTYEVEGVMTQPFAPGSIYTFKLTLDNAGLVINGMVEITPWQENNSASTENGGVLKPSV